MKSPVVKRFTDICDLKLPPSPLVLVRDKVIIMLYSFILEKAAQFSESQTKFSENRPRAL